MRLMATWEDGPEYAPHERPAAFTTPAVAPLSARAPRPQPSAGAPTRAPVEYAQHHPVAPLNTHGAPMPERRDPTQAFSVATTPLTSGNRTETTSGYHSAWTSAHADSEYSQINRPVVPWQQAPAPTPTARPGQVTAGEVFRAAHPGVLISLMVGALLFALSWIPPLALGAAAIFSTQTRRAKDTVQTVLVGGASIILGWFLITILLNGIQVGPAIRSAANAATILCWIGLPVVLAVVSRAIARGE